MNWLNIISKDHCKWIEFVKTLGENNYAEDIVQEMYLKLHAMDNAQRNSNDKRYALNYSTEDRVLNQNGTSNASYIKMVLYTMFIDFKKELNKYSNSEINETEEEEILIDNEKAWGAFISVVEREMQTWQKYDRLLFNLYSTKKISMRSIAKELDVDVRSVWNTINNCKTKIKVRLNDDYKELKQIEND